MKSELEIALNRLLQEQAKLEKAVLAIHNRDQYDIMVGKYQGLQTAIDVLLEIREGADT